jgi:hypothetical protein
LTDEEETTGDRRSTVSGGAEGQTCGFGRSPRWRRSLSGTLLPCQ